MNQSSMSSRRCAAVLCTRIIRRPHLSIEQLAQIFGRGSNIANGLIWVKVPGCDSDEMVVVSRQNNSAPTPTSKRCLNHRGEASSTKAPSARARWTCMVPGRGGSDQERPPAPSDLAADWPAPRTMWAGLCRQRGQAAAVNPIRSHRQRPLLPIAVRCSCTPAASLKGEIKNYMDWILSDA